MNNYKDRVKSPFNSSKNNLLKLSNRQGHIERCLQRLKEPDFVEQYSIFETISKYGVKGYHIVSFLLGIMSLVFCSLHYNLFSYSSPISQLLVGVLLFFVLVVLILLIEIFKSRLSSWYFKDHFNKVKGGSTKYAAVLTGLVLLSIFLSSAGAYFGTLVLNDQSDNFALSYQKDSLQVALEYDLKIKSLKDDKNSYYQNNQIFINNRIGTKLNPKALGKYNEYTTLVFESENQKQERINQLKESHLKNLDKSKNKNEYYGYFAAFIILIFELLNIMGYRFMYWYTAQLKIIADHQPVIQAPVKKGVSKAEELSKRFLNYVETLQNPVETLQNALETLQTDKKAFQNVTETFPIGFDYTGETFQNVSEKQCLNAGCNNPVYGNSNKKFCSNKCRLDHHRTVRKNEQEKAKNK